MNKKINDARFLLRSWCGRHPFSLKFIAPLRGFNEEVCSRKTDIVVEAYPRCANTYTVAAFKILFGGNVRIARHRHASAQFKIAEKLNKPSVLIVRKPLDAVSSLAIRRPEVSVNLLIKEYVAFHKDVMRLLGEASNVRILLFEDVVKSPDKLVEVARSIPGLSIIDPLPSEEKFSDAVFSIVEEMEREDSGGQVRESHVARPSNKRQEKKKEISEIVMENHALMQEAEEIYRSVVLHAHNSRCE